MKKLFVLALLSVAFNAMAEDQYLYWMVADNATVDDQALDRNKTYYAQVKAVMGDGTETLLNFYASPEAGVDYGSWAEVDMSFNAPTFAGVFTTAPTSFIVELYNEKDTSAAGSWVGQATLNWDPSYITSGGRTIADYATATAFQSIPEPTSGLLLLLGVAGLALRRKNKKA